MLYIIYRTLNLLLWTIDTAVLVYCVLSWIAPNSRAFGVLAYLIEPFVRPFRPLGRWIIQKTGIPLDFSIILLLIALQILQRILLSIFVALI